MAVGLLLLALIAPAAWAASIGGQTIREGKQMELRFPVAPYFQNYAAQGGNPRPTTGRAVFVFPKGFDPKKNWPLLIVTSTSDAGRTSPMDVDFYEQAALAQGWVILASDATIKPKIDSTVWRLALLSAALEVVHGEWPQSAKWPVAFAGLSGGAKQSGVLGMMLAQTKSLNICGFFLAGINDDRLGATYKEYHPSAEVLNVPIWLSSGMSDYIATPGKFLHVKASLEGAGFKRVRLESFPGGHQVNSSEVRRALRWFRELGRF